MKAKNVKRFTLLAAGCAALLCAQAREVSPAEALSRLSASSPRANRAAGITGTPRASLVFTANIPDQDAPAVYVFNRPDGAGFLVLPADDQALPLLGYSNQGSFDPANMPPQMTTWLEGYARQIDWARQHPAAPSITVGTPGAGASDAAGGARSPRFENEWPSIEPVCKTKWDQTAPYWDDCPTDAQGNHCYTGCVATAMAQVMKVYDYPVQPTGEVSYNDRGVNRRMNYDDIQFDWANMLNSYSRGYNAEQGAAVALLMKACGYGAHMGYTTDGSGAQEATGVAAMKTNFDYSADAQVLSRDYFPLDEWEQMVYTNIEAGCPVLYCGFTPKWEGHAFIVDGYSTEGFFHLNWGWSGAYDGYFRLFGLNPEGFGSGGASGGFNVRQTGAFGLQPTPQATLEPYEYSIVQMGSLKGTVSSSRLTLKATGQNPMVIANDGTSGRFDLGAALVPVDGSETTYVTIYSNQQINRGYGLNSLAFTLPTSSLANGDYRVHTVYRRSGSDKWLDTRCQVSAISHIMLNKNGGSYTVSEPVIPLPVASDPQFTNFFVGRNTHLSVTLTNPADGREFLNSVVVGLFTATDNPEEVGQLTDEQPVDISAGRSQSVSFNGYFRSNDNKKVTEGEYLMGFFDSASGKSLGDSLFLITIAPNPGYPTLRRDAFAVEGDPNNVDPTSMAFNVKVTCTKGFYDENLTVAVFDVATTTNVAQESSQPLSLVKGESAQVRIPVQAPGAMPGEYIAALYWVKTTASSSTTLQLGSPIRFTIVDPSGVAEVAADEAADTDAAVYTIDGRLARAAGSDAPLAPGFYIRSGKKFIVR